MKSILIDVHFSSTNVAVVEDGTLVEFWVERKNNANIVGNIYKGKVKNFVPGMQASFVDIGRERNAYLYDKDVTVDDEKISASSAAHFRSGDDILCQVTKDEFGSKGARITTNITLAGRVLVLMPQTDYVGVSRKITDENRRQELIDYVQKVRPAGCGVILRTQSESCGREEIAEEMQYLYEPNASLMKAGCFSVLSERYGARMLSKNSHLFVSQAPIEAFPGRSFRIIAISSFNKKELKRHLSGITKANIATRNFPLSVAELRKRLKLKDGGETYIFATTLSDESHVLVITEKA